MASVDVVVPSYQYGRFLRECVTSVLSQDLQDVRVLIIDNASTDNSLEVAHELGVEDRRVQVVAHRTNLGHHASVNVGIEWASSDYFMILCADDLLAPGCLKRAVSFMEKNPVVHLTFGRDVTIFMDDPAPRIEPCAQEPQWRVLSGKQFLKRICRSAGRHNIGGPTVVVRTSVQKRVGFYRPELSNTDDLEMWMRFACLGAAAETDAVQGVGRLHSLNSSRSVRGGYMWDLHFEAAFESFFANEGARASEAQGLRQVARRSLAGRAYWGAIANLLRGDARQSLDLWKFAFTRCPTTIVLPPVSYLLRRDDAFKRIVNILLEAAR
jgi:glycosyltransferase involved in cell wall biosynthesis